MKVKKTYSKPNIEEHFIDKGIVYLFGSLPTPPSAAPESSPPTLKSAPKYDNPPAQDYPFGSDSPDYTNM